LTGAAVKNRLEINATSNDPIVIFVLIIALLK
jgi:hypothetical protein